MSEFKQTRLWRSTLAPQRGADAHREARDRLRNAYLQSREVAALVGSQLAKEQPELTVHDITHADGLWDLADTIAGPQLELNPVEAYVLGLTFLTHDLAMVTAPYPSAADVLMQDRGYRDALALAPAPEPRTPASGWRARGPSGGDPGCGASRLLPPAARQERRSGPSPGVARCGRGRVAPRHRRRRPPRQLREADRQDRRQPRLGGGQAPTGVRLAGWPGAGLPPSWSVDPLKLAVLLRTADAAHLDGRRAPPLLLSLRNISGVSLNHWLFQGMLNQPIRTDDRLFFSTSRPFAQDEADAWWLGAEALKMLDTELRQVDDLLADTGRPRLAARSVAGVSDALRLVEHLPTEGWLPIDAQVRVTDVIGLVRKLGGEELYGRDTTVPLRELVENGADAVRALAALSPGKPGAVTVRIGEGADGWWLEVDDTGIGMSKDVLAGALLDFGHSFWGTDLMRRELPGLLASSFQPTGGYGVGFFSVFMVSNQVRVTSRRFDAAVADTHVLEFSTGLEGRPILRAAEPGEQRAQAGTSIRIWPTERWFDSPDGPTSVRSRLKRLATACSRLFPTLDVDLLVGAAGSPPKRAVGASDWVRLKPRALFDRCPDRGSGRLRPSMPSASITCGPSTCRTAISGVVPASARATARPAPSPWVGRRPGQSSKGWQAS